MMHGSVNDFINYLQRRNPMIDSLRPFLSRAIAPFVTMGLTWVAVHWGIAPGADAAGHITETAVIIIVGGMQIVYGLIHRGIDKKVNPVDAASTPIAVQAKVESEQEGA